MPRAPRVRASKNEGDEGEQEEGARTAGKARQPVTSQELISRPRVLSGKDLRPLTRKLNKDSKCSEFGPFLQQANQALQLRFPGEYDLHELVLCWKDGKEKRKYEMLYKPELITDESTVAKWARETRHGLRCSIALMKTWTESPRAKTVEAWGVLDWHMWVLMIWHAPQGAHGKKVVVWDGNLGGSVTDMRRGEVLKFRNGFVEVAQRGANTEVWVNKSSKANSTGQCVRLTLEWLLSAVDKGVCTRDFQGIVRA
ncbi:hypothetical protein B0H11DRAFT_1992558 [Mycena galericulata]|nr:hypothetical protein B0H11DRAFT_1992558 [Mycena galericulata]